MDDRSHVARAGGELKQAVLFRARQGGYHTYRIPGLVVTAKGTVLAYCEARKDSPWDYGPIDILLRRSVDGGETWTEPTVLVAGGGKAANNAVMIVDPDTAVIHFLYCIAYKRCFYTLSHDDGLTFAPPTEITDVFEQYRPEYDWHLIATGPGHGLRLRSGRLLVPVWLSTTEQQKPTMVSVIYSDNHGKQWHRGPMILRDGDGQDVANPMEPIAVELQDGRVMFNVRNASSSQRRAVSTSPDGVNGWEPFRFDPQLREPFSMAAICRFSSRPHDPDHAIVWANPDNLTQSGQPGTACVGGSDRKCMTVRLSTDEGKTWQHSRVLEPGWSGYCDLAVGRDKTIYCLYESGCIDNMMWEIESIQLARFDRKWIEHRG